MTKGGREYQLSAAFSCIRSNYVRIFQAQRKHRSPMGNRRISTQHTIPKQQTIIAHGSLTQSHIIAASNAPVMWYPIQNSRVTLPLIGRSSHAHGIFFTDEDWKRNKASGKSARLVNFPDIPIEDYPERHKAYIALGEASGENEGYKCSIRDRWYIVPSVWVPDAFFLRRNNLYPKFVLNRCNAVSTDTMHRMKFNSDVKPENILLADT